MERKTLLLVEDDSSVREIIRDALHTDYHVLEASCHTEAAKHFETHFHLALIDYMLPDCDGFDIAKKVREKNPSLPVILMTAYNHEDVIVKALRAGLTDYVKKPLNLRDLKRRVCAILEGKALDTACENGVVKRKHDFIMDSIGEYIEKNYMKDLNLDALAKKAGMSRFFFCRTFKERFGKSFVSYLNEVRIQKAAALLRNDDLSVTEVALFVGYSNVEYFERRFKSFNEITPREYRNR